MPVWVLMQGECVAKKRVPAELRFFEKVDRHGPVSTFRPDLGPCHIWTAGKTTGNYGLFHGGRDVGSMTAHIYSYHFWMGVYPADDGMHLDHLCREPSCVNPIHLEPVLPGENHYRGILVKFFNEGRVAYLGPPTETHCPLGHEYVEQPPFRQCQECLSFREKSVQAKLDTLALAL